MGNPVPLLVAVFWSLQPYIFQESFWSLLRATVVSLDGLYALYRSGGVGEHMLPEFFLAVECLSAYAAVVPRTSTHRVAKQIRRVRRLDWGRFVRRFRGLDWGLGGRLNWWGRGLN